MRLMFIVPRRSGGGGAEKVIANLASGLADCHEVYLVSMWGPLGFPYPVSDRVNVIGLENKSGVWGAFDRLWRFLHLSHFTWLGRVKEYFDNQYRIKAVRRLKRELGIDCAVSFLSPANALNTATGTECPAIISIRSCMVGEYAPHEAREPAGKNTLIYSCQHADRIVSVSREAVNGLVESFGAGPEKIAVIYNPCDLERIKRLGDETPDDEAILRRMEEAGFVFISSGRITPKKGQWHLIHAFSQVQRRHPEALLVILGRIDNKKTESLLRRTIAEKQLEEHVLLAGFHENPFAYVSRGDTFVLSSFNEGFPNALVEAMALGLPVISTDCRSGPREILAPGTVCTEKTTGIDAAEYGILTPECSGDDRIDRPAERNEMLLAEAMLSLMENPELRKHYSKQSLERASHFGKEDFLAQWETLIRDAVQNGKNRSRGKSSIKGESK
ncbi:MAG: glycosyltransferase [Oscillospiraceae bacterium]|nr:glycosyltransferase [Oscillospiraceae bacterium]